MLIETLSKGWKEGKTINTIRERGWEIDYAKNMIILYYPYKINGLEKEVVKNITFDEIKEIQVSLEKSENYFVLFITIINSGDMYLIDPLYIYKSEEQFKHNLNTLRAHITFNDPYNIIQRYLSGKNLSLQETVKEILSENLKSRAC